MNEKAMTMKNEIRALANFRALLISKRYISFLLVLTSLYLGIMRYVMSPLYILIVFQVLPPIIAFTLKDYAQKYKYQLLINATNDKPFLLSHLKVKYKYSKVKYIANSISYVLAVILISLWQYSNKASNNINAFLVYAPVLILTTGIILRFLAILFYRFKLPYNLYHNKV
jgi:hypothetical protein